MAGVYKTPVIEKELFTPELMRVRVDIAGQSGWDFLPGQYVSADLGGVRRSYSLVNTPAEKNYIDFLVDIAPGGPGSQYFSGVKVGDVMSLLGPLGRFIYQPEENSSAKAYFFATGVGIAPLLSMIQYELETARSGREVILYYGIRSPERAMVETTLQRWAAEYSNFHYQIFVSRPPETFTPQENWQTGRITQIIPQLTFSPSEQAYICGGKEMIDEVVDLLKLQGMTDTSIHFERFY